MSKKTALLLFFFFDLLAVFAFWLGYDEIKMVYSDIADSADVVSFNNRVGFLSFAVGVPIVHVFTFIFYWWQKALEKKAVLINLSFIILGISLFAFSLSISTYMRSYVEKAGYQHCPEADDRMTFSTYLVYTRDDAVCRGLVADKEKGHSTASK